MVEPVGVVATILTVVPMIWNAALTARQNKEKCLELATRARNLGQALPSFASAAANDAATAHGLARLNDALRKALCLIESCQDGGFIRAMISRKADDLDSVDRTINNCLSDLNFFSIARAHAMSTHGVTAAAQTCDHSSYHHHHQAQGGAPSLQHLWGAPPAPGYYQQPGYAQWVPGPPPSPYYYAAPPAPSGSKLSSLFPTVNKIVNRVLR